MAPLVRLTRRRLPLVFGAARRGPPIAVVRVRLTCRVPTSRSMSSHLSAGSRSQGGRRSHNRQIAEVLCINIPPCFVVPTRPYLGLYLCYF